MKIFFKVVEDNGITALRMDIQEMANWIKDISIAKNQIISILFVWDELLVSFSKIILIINIFSD